MSIRSKLLVAFSLALGACGEAPHDVVYTAQAYDAENHCIEAPSALALIEESSVSANCAPVCLEFDSTLYLSSLCPPYPAEATLLSASDSPACDAGLALYREYLADDAHATGSCDSQ